MTTSLLIIGGPDVDARIPLLNLMKHFHIAAAGSEKALAAPFAAGGYRYFRYPLHRGANPILDLYSLFVLVALLRRIRPDIVHTFDTKPAVWGRIAARWAGVPIVLATIPGLGSLFSDDSLAARLKRLVYRPLQAWACQISDLTVFQNSHDADEFVDLQIVSRERTAIIRGSGVETERFSRERVTDLEKRAALSEARLPPGSLVVLMISRVIRSKGVLEFAKAAAAITKANPDVRFVLIGPPDPESSDRLTDTEIDELNKNLDWLGPKEDVRVWLALADIFVLPTSYREGIPRVLLEAASMALPIITTQMPGCTEVVEHEANGILIESGDTNGLIRAVLRLVREPETRRQFGLRSRDLAVSRFDLSIVAGETERLYRQLLEKRRIL